MKKLLALLMLLLFLLLTWLSWNWYKKTVSCCQSETQPKEIAKKEVEKEIIPDKVKQGPLMYSWDKISAITNDLWQDKQEEILSGLKDGKILQIVGPYFSDETNSSNFENMGLARAEEVKRLFEGKIDLSKIETSSRLVEIFDGAKENLFAETNFRWVVRNENIQEVNGKTLIYFPTNSSSKLDNGNINSYLKSVAESVKSSGKNITLTGHTDSDGNADSNKTLALKRANAIRNILISYGVDAEKVQAFSNGEETPIADNNTKEGKQKNRRVELEIK